MSPPIICLISVAVKDRLIQIILTTIMLTNEKLNYNILDRNSFILLEQQKSG